MVAETLTNNSHLSEGHREIVIENYRHFALQEPAIFPPNKKNFLLKPKGRPYSPP